MTKAELAALVNQNLAEHKTDKDGGYALITAVSQLYSTLGAPDQSRLQQFLLDRVENKDPELWGVALEVLIRHSNREIAAKFEELARATEDAEFKEQLILALLRIGHHALDLYLPHIKSLTARNRSFCPELAHLYRVSREHSLAIAARFFAEELQTEAGFRRAENCVAVLVQNYAEEDESSLASLVDETHKLSAKAATQLRLILINYLNKSWVSKELGEDKKNRVLGFLIEADQ